MNQQQIRPYVMALYDLQDGFRAILKGPGAEGQGCVQESKMTLKDDRTQELKFSIPMYIRENGELKENPIWYTTQDGNLITGMRKIKVIFGDAVADISAADDFIKIEEVTDNNYKVTLDSIFAESDNETQTLFLDNARIINAQSNNNDYAKIENENSGILKAAAGLDTLSIFEFVITKVTESHENGILTCEVECEGLAFQELGKTGYKISLNQDEYELEYGAFYDGIIAQVNPFKSFKGLQINEQDKTGYSLNLIFKELNNENKWVSVNPAEVELKIDSSYKIDSSKEYILNFYCTNNLNKEITWSIDGDKNIYNLKEDNEAIIFLKDEDIQSLKLFFYNGKETKDITVVTSFTLKQKEDVIANIDYWVNKVLDGTRWSYTVRNDWSSYDGVIVNNYDRLGAAARNTINESREKNNLRRMDKVYEDEYVSAWGKDGAPSAYEYTKEKQRIVEASESNRFNILQDIAEKFEVNCKMVYHYDDYFRIIDREVVFFNNFIKDRDVIDISYPYDTNKISREMDCNDIVTKLFIKPIDDDTNMVSGQISITDAPCNHSKEDYILNFDYLYSIGSISKDQLDEVENYEKDMSNFNTQMAGLSTSIAAYQTALVEKEALLTTAENKIKEANERIDEANDKIKAIIETNGNTVLKYEKEAYVAILLGDNTFNIYKSGIDKKTFSVYGDSNKQNKLEIDSDKTKESIESTTFTLKSGSSGSSQLYCYFEYKPTLYYSNVVNDYTKVLSAAVKDKEDLEKDVKNYNKDIESKQNELAQIKRSKEKRMASFERYMGPAIREGNWQDDEYIDLGNKNTVILEEEKGTNNEDEIYYNLDEKAFDEEQKLYYESGVNKEKIYYRYIDITGKDFSDYEDSFLSYNDYWIKLKSKPDKSDGIGAWDKETIYKKEDKCYTGTGSAWWESAIDDNLNNIPGMNTNVKYLSIGSGLQPAIVEFSDGTIKIVLLITKEDLTEEEYNNIEAKGRFVKLTSTLITDEKNESKYVAIPTDSRTGDIIPLPSKIEQIKEKDKIIHPRIKINNMLLKSNDNLKIYCGKKAIESNLLKEFEDYTSLVRYANGEDEEECYCLTIKPEIFLKYKITNPEAAEWLVNYTISNAATSVYLDAKKVSKENAFPQVSYEVSINAINDEIVSNLYNRLDQICHINDYELKFQNVRGYISEIELDLDNPWEDSIKIQNYKSKFEDLFSSIVASTEQMKTNGTAYNRAANSFLSTGSINTEALGDALNSGLLNYSFDSGSLTIDEKRGIWATSDSGVVAMRGGGISVADSKDASGNWIWNTGITPSGINASLINAGQINLEKIFIYAGNNVAYQMNSSGLYAYRNDSGDRFKTDEYVVHNGDGLFLVNEDVEVNGEKVDINRVEISWDGLIIRNNLNEKVFYADDKGNLTIAGTIQAKDGYIGEWLIKDGGLVNSDMTFGINPNSGSAIWVRDGAKGTYFEVDSDGIVYASSIILDDTLVADEAMIGGVPLTKVIEKVGMDKGVYFSQLIGNKFLFAISEGGDSIDTLKFYVSVIGYDSVESLSLKYKEENGDWTEVDAENYFYEEQGEADRFIFEIYNRAMLGKDSLDFKFVADVFDGETGEDGILESESFRLYSDSVPYQVVLNVEEINNTTNLVRLNAEIYDGNGLVKIDDENEIVESGEKEQLYYEWYKKYKNGETIEKLVVQRNNSNKCDVTLDDFINNSNYYYCEIWKDEENYNNPNLFDNWYFIDPVNTNNITSFASGQKGLDRWVNYTSSAVNVVDGGIRLPRNANISQKINNISDYVGKTLTASILYEGGLVYGSAVLNSINERTYFLTLFNEVDEDYCRFEWNTDVNAIVIKMDYHTIFAVKLEEGEEQTLAHEENEVWILNEMPNKNTETNRLSSMNDDGSSKS